jgi:hypothetical protein
MLAITFNLYVGTLNTLLDIAFNLFWGGQHFFS